MLLEERAWENGPWDVGLIIISTVTNCMKNMFKLDYVCIQNDSKNETKNIFRTICTVIAHVLGMEAKFNCLRWIIQMSMPKVV